MFKCIDDYEHAFEKNKDATKSVYCIKCCNTFYDDEDESADNIIHIKSYDQSNDDFKAGLSALKKRRGSFRRTT